MEDVLWNAIKMPVYPMQNLQAVSEINLRIYKVP